MKELTKHMAEEAIEKFVKDYELHGQAAMWTFHGKVLIELWINKSVTEARYELPVEKFIHMSQHSQLPRWRNWQGRWWIESPNDLSRYRVY